MAEVIGDAANALKVAHQALEALELEATGEIAEPVEGDVAGDAGKDDGQADFTLSVALSLASMAESHAIIAGLMIGWAHSQLRSAGVNDKANGHGSEELPF